MKTLTQKRGNGKVSAPAALVSNADPEPAWENPLIPNKRLRALYIAMVELRLLETRIKRRSRLVDGASAEEGCRASTVLCLQPKDMVSDTGQGLATAFLRGVKLTEVVLNAHATRAKQEPKAPIFPGQLPALPDTADRLHFALGAAFSLRASTATGSKSALVVAYVYAADLNASQWTSLLTTAAKCTLPLLLVVLPNRQKTQGIAAPGRLSQLAGTCAVPGIPVDAADSVALFRVAQESTLRSRTGGGPVLMECIPFQLAGKKPAAADPIVTMQQSMLHRKIVDEQWLHRVETRFTARLHAIIG